jgi:hypothetical protein
VGVADTRSVSLEEDFNVLFGSLAKGNSHTPSWATVRSLDLDSRSLSPPRRIKKTSHRRASLTIISTITDVFFTS